MQTIYPKKAVPFNAVSNRGLSRDISGGGNNSSPGKLLVLSLALYFILFYCRTWLVQAIFRF